MDDETKNGLAWAAIVLFVLAVGVGGCAYVVPQYNVWEHKMRGEAELARAQQNRQISIAEAEAKKESARLLAEAEVERAKGVSEANKIIADSLDGNDAYLRYLWIQQLGESSNDVIYIPTEAGLPILEANRRAPTRPFESAPE